MLINSENEEASKRSKFSVLLNQKSRPKVKMKLEPKRIRSIQNIHIPELLTVCSWLLLTICVILINIQAAEYQQQFDGSSRFQPQLEERKSTNTRGQDEERELVVGSRWQNELLLPCRLLNLEEDQTVSWIRRRDSLVLSVDRLTLTDDSRFRLLHGAGDWTLALSSPQPGDAGLYECQVSSVEPKLSKLVELRILEANSQISSTAIQLNNKQHQNSNNNNISISPSIYLKPGDSLNLSCTIQAPQRTDFVYWYRNKDPIRFEDLRSRATKFRASGGESLTRTAASAEQPPELEHSASSSVPVSSSSSSSSSNFSFSLSLSSLQLQRVQANDSANYTCLPSNAKPSQVSVIVIENGPQSQPEKRSLQVTDSANAHNSLVFIKDILLVADIVRLKVAVYYHYYPTELDHSTVIHNKKEYKEEESLKAERRLFFSCLLARLVMNQDFLRLSITLANTFCISYLVSSFTSNLQR